jgi:hypothetical protein
VAVLTGGAGFQEGAPAASAMLMKVLESRRVRQDVMRLCCQQEEGLALFLLLRVFLRQVLQNREP